MAGFEKDLALELEEIGIVRPGADQRVRLRVRLGRMSAAVIGISAGIMGRDRLVGDRIADQDALRIVDIARKLGANALEPLLERRRGLRGPGGIGLVALLEPLDPVPAERVGLGIAVNLSRRGNPVFQILDPAEEGDRAAAADAGA